MTFLIFNYNCLMLRLLLRLYFEIFTKKTKTALTYLYNPPNFF